MNKSIIITGKQGSGKTTRMKEILSKFDPDRVIQLYYKDLQVIEQDTNAGKYKLIAIEEVHSRVQLEHLLKLQEVFGVQILVTTQSEIKDLTDTPGSFEIIPCNYRF
jgi:uridine kinase